MYHLHCLQPFTTTNYCAWTWQMLEICKDDERTVEESTGLAATSSSCVISRISLCTTGCCGVDNPWILRTSLHCFMQNFCHQSWGPIITLWDWKKLPNPHLGQHTPQRPSNNPPILLCNRQKVPSLNNSCVNDGITYTKTPKHQPDSRHLSVNGTPAAPNCHHQNLIIQDRCVRWIIHPSATSTSSKEHANFSFLPSIWNLH